MPHESDIIRRVNSYMDPTIMCEKIPGTHFKAGLPDTYYLGPGDSSWIEWKKIPNLPKREATVITPKLSALQRSKIRSLYGYLPSCRVIVYAEAERVFLVYENPEQWEKGMTAKEIEAYGNLLAGYAEAAQYIENLVD